MINFAFKIQILTKTYFHTAYFPSILQAAAITQSKVICIEMQDNYQKQSYRNRSEIATANGKLTLTIPVKHITETNERKKTKNALIDNSFLWQRQHWRSLKNAYQSSPFFEYYEDDLEPIFKKEYTHLAEVNKASLIFILDALQLDTTIEETDSYQDKYDTGDFRNLINPKIKNKQLLPFYNQVFESYTGFIPHLSVLDLIFNLGPNALEYLENIQL